VSTDTRREDGVLHASRFGRLDRVKRVFATKLSAGLVSILLAALVTGGCGGSSSSKSTTTTTGTGGLYTIMGDTPSCDVLGFALFVTELDLHPQGSSSTTKVTVYPVIEFGTLRDTSTIANVTTLSAGTYDQAFLTLTVNSAAKYDPTVSPPASILTTNITTTDVTVNLQPPLVVSDGKISMLQLDFNLAQSLETDSQGQLTGNVTPVFTGRPVVASEDNGFDEFDSLEGFVRSVQSSSSTAGFTSSFTLQTLSGRGPALTVNLTDSTQLLGVDRIDQMPTGSFVEVDAFVDSKGNLVAKGIQVEDREDITKQMLAYLGPILRVTKDSSGNVTQFDMLVRNTEPDDSSNVSLDSNVTVIVSPSTTFNAYSLSSDLTNLANAGNLVFNAQTLAPGQEVAVHGIYTKPTNGLVSVAADKVYLRLQPVQGDFSSLIHAESDDRTGGFQFAPCSGLLQATPFIVVTDAQTEFVKAVGLSSLSPTTPLLVRGLSFLDVQGGTVNGVTVPAGTMVLLANHVRQF
jgi:hypothetical protein